MSDGIGINDLSPRQRDILTGLIQGKTRREIAGDLGISPKTVSAHLEILYDRLRVRNRVEAAVIGVNLMAAEWRQRV